MLKCAIINFVFILSDRNIGKLEPMNANFGIFRLAYDGPKNDKKKFYVEHALNKVDEFAKLV